MSREQQLEQALRDLVDDYAFMSRSENRTRPALRSAVNYARSILNNPASQASKTAPDATGRREPMRTLTEKDVEITIHVEQDQIPVRGNAMASGDDAVDKEVEDEILRRLDNGDVWAWCCVTVRASWEGPSGREYVGEDNLGACNYKSERDFKEAGDYYPDMVANALADLNRDLAESAADVASLETT